MIGFVYLWINKVNGKKYVGMHVGSEDDGYIGSGIVFRRAVKKYKIENFERKILYREFNNEQSLYQKEFDIINELNAVFSTEYYNMTNYDPKFVIFINGKKYRLVTPETRERMRVCATGRKLSKETKDKMSRTRQGRTSPTKGMTGLTSGGKNGQFGKKWYNNGHTDGTFLVGEEPDGWVLGRIRGVKRGKDNPFFGKHHSKETKRQLREKMVGRYDGENNPFFGRVHSNETKIKMRSIR
jgi:hypothetical protein